MKRNNIGSSELELRGLKRGTQTHISSIHMHLLVEERINTHFFHIYASTRHRKNKIRGLLDNEGNWVTSMVGIEEIIKDYFSSFFSSFNMNAEEKESVLSFLQAKATDEMNWELDIKFTSDELKNAVMQMHLANAPRPDGFSPTFFQDL